MMGTTQLDQPSGGGPETVVGASDAASGPPERLSTDSTFEVLSNERRRLTLRYLNEVDDGPVRLRDLAERIAAWENDIPVDEVTYKERKRVYTSLHQLHLEKMDRFGVVSYDCGEGTVTRTDATGRLQRYLDEENTIDEPESNEDDVAWGSVSFALAACCAILVAAAWIGILPAVSGNGFAVASGVVSLFALVSGAQLIDERR